MTPSWFVEKNLLSRFLGVAVKMEAGLDHNIRFLLTVVAFKKPVGLCEYEVSWGL